MHSYFYRLKNCINNIVGINPDFVQFFSAIGNGLCDANFNKFLFVLKIFVDGSF